MLFFLPTLLVSFGLLYPSTQLFFFCSTLSCRLRPSQALLLSLLSPDHHSFLILQKHLSPILLGPNLLPATIATMQSDPQLVAGQ